MHTLYVTDLSSLLINWFMLKVTLWRITILAPTICVDDIKLGPPLKCDNRSTAQVEEHFSLVSQNNVCGFFFNGYIECLFDELMACAGGESTLA